MNCKDLNKLLVYKNRFPVTQNLFAVSYIRLSNARIEFENDRGYR